jgi:hypothetical protein
MKTGRGSAVPAEKLLCILAREFRGTQDEHQRLAIADEYAKAVKQLIRSKSWEEIPPLEDQLPDEWMPDAFFAHWSLRPPIRRTAKPAIITEGKQDIVILSALLPADLLRACELQSAGGRPNLAQHARERLLKHHAPIVLLFDSNTLDQAAIAEMVRGLKDQVASAAVGIPYDVACCIPHIEILFLDGALDLPRIFPRFKAVFTRKLAKTDPKRQLEVLFEKGEGPRTLTDFLGQLTPEELEQVRAEEPIQRIVTFVANNNAPVIHGDED